MLGGGFKLFVTSGPDVPSQVACGVMDCPLHISLLVVFFFFVVAGSLDIIYCSL